MKKELNDIGVSHANLKSSHLPHLSFGEYPICVRCGDKDDEVYFNECGKYFNQYGECILFPSSEHRTWKDWQKVLIPKCVGSVIVSSDCTSICDYEWIVTKNGMFATNMNEDETVLHPFNEMYYDDLVFATPKETEAFFERLDKLGYKFENGEVVVKDLKNMGCESWCKYDAKDGDFIRTYDLDTIIFSRISNGGAECYVSYNKKEDRLSIPKRGTFYFDIDSIYRPATQEEKDELLKKLDEEGYIWNQEELRLELKEKEWSIFDAKDGDFIVNQELNTIFKFNMIFGEKVRRYITYNIDKDSIEKNEEKPYDVYPYSKNGVTIYRPATNDEIQMMFEKIKENELCELRSDSINKTVGKNEEKKFTINDFKPFDKVLVKDDGGGCHWNINLFSYYDETSYYPYKCLTGCFTQCVPYNKETAYLLGTAENYNGKYKTWEGE